MEETKKKLEQIFNDTFKNLFDAYNIVKRHFGAENVDIQKINSFNTFWNTNKDSRVFNVFGIDSYKITNQESAELRRRLLNCTLENTPVEDIEYLAVSQKLLNVYTPEIIIHWDTVTVKNEFERSVKIQDLYACIKVRGNGCLVGQPEFKRTTYSQDQWNSGYTHSHIPRIRYEAEWVTKWQRSCLGQGPIRNTIAKLINTYSPQWWALYCLELSKYVQVESIAGGPYIRMESIGEVQDCVDCIDYTKPVHTNIRNDYFVQNVLLYRFFTREDFNGFIKEVIEKLDLNFSYFGQYVMTMPYEIFALKVSNMFIHWLNNADRRILNRSEMTKDNLLSRYVVREGVFKDGILYIGEIRESNYNLEGTPILKFKKEIKYLHILRRNRDDEEREIHKTILLNRVVISYIYNTIHAIINAAMLENVKPD